MLKKVQMRGGARRPHARRSLSTLSVRPRAPTKQMGLFQHPARLLRAAVRADRAALDHELDPLGLEQDLDVVEWVAVHDHEIRQAALLHRAQLALEAEALGRPPR